MNSGAQGNLRKTLVELPRTARHDGELLPHSVDLDAFELKAAYEQVGQLSWVIASNLDAMRELVHQRSNLSHLA